MNIAHFSDAYLPNISGVSYAVEAFASEQAKRHKVKLYVPSYTKDKLFESRDGVEIFRYFSVPFPTYKETHLAVPDLVDIYKSLLEFNLEAQWESP